RSVRDARVRGGANRRRRSQVHGVARGRAGGRGRVSAGRLVLGIETSCDDTSVAVLESGTRLRCHLIASQDLHRLYGGVVPELAARAHLELLPRLAQRALRDAEIGPGDLPRVAGAPPAGL